MEDLPNDILFKIFAFVPVDLRGQCSLLSRHYRRLLALPDAWFDFSFDGVADDQCTLDLAAGAVARARGQLRTLCLRRAIFDSSLVELVELACASAELRVVSLTDLSPICYRIEDEALILALFDDERHRALHSSVLKGVAAVMPGRVTLVCDVECTTFAAARELVQTLGTQVQIRRLLFNADSGFQDDEFEDEEEVEEAVLCSMLDTILGHPFLAEIELVGATFLTLAMVKKLIDRKTIGLRFIDCGIDEHCFAFLARAVRDGLVYLTVRETDHTTSCEPFMQHAVAAEFCEAVRWSTALKSLCLGGWTVAQDISPMLIRACTAHCSLEELDLQQCIFAGEGDALMESLRALTAAPSVLTGVSLCGASLSSTMLHAMLEGVQSNTSLRSLTFSPMPAVLTAEEMDMVRRCTSLRHVACHAPALTAEIAARV
jgi:F-box domain